MARTVYDNQRVYTAEVKAGSFEKTYPYAVMLNGTRDYKTGTNVQSVKGVALLESDFPIFIEKLEARNIYRYVMYLYGHGSFSDKITPNARLSCRTTADSDTWSEKYHQSSFIQCDSLIYTRGETEIDSNVHPDYFSRIENAQRVFIESIAYASKTSSPSTVGSITFNLARSYFGTYASYEFPTGEGVIGYDTYAFTYVNVDNPVFETKAEWYAWCKEHDNG